jgi:hypothetical protein
VVLFLFPSVVLNLLAIGGGAPGEAARSPAMGS